MTKEQEEAIERIEELRDSYELHQRSWANRCLNIIEDYVKNSVYKNKMMEETEYSEEDKAIEKFKKYIENDNFYNTYKEVKEDKRQGKIGGTHIDFCKAIETVLSMLKEKDEQIAKYEKIYKEYDCYRWVKELDKKDKIIDLMAKAMDKIQDPQVCKYCDNKINLSHGYCVDAGKCKEGIKRYFERKSEE